MTRRTVLLFTECYPFRNYTEEVFVKPDIEALSHEFDRVVIVPLIRKSEIGHIDLPNVTVDTTLADDKGIQNRWMKRLWLLHPFTLRHLIPAFRDTDTPNNSILRNIIAYANTAYTSRVIRKVIDRYYDPASKLPAYTFWFDTVTSAIALLKPHYPQLVLVSRAHGHDLYDNRYCTAHPRELRRNTIRNMAALFPISNTGTQYLRQRFSEHDNKINTAFLGSSKPSEVLNSGHNPADNIITFLSVARIEPGKHVERNLELVTEMARRHPDLMIEWLHVGDGSLMNELKLRLNNLPQNLHIELIGAVENKAVHSIYSDRPIDWTILLSDSEGIPISLCESFSYSVPTIASEVGGVPEIVNSTNGILVKPATNASLIVDIIDRYMHDYGSYTQLKNNALRTWQSLLQEKKLRKDFVCKLISLIY